MSAISASAELVWATLWATLKPTRLNPHPPTHTHPPSLSPALITATEVGDFKMVCARNPWGNSKEWNGAWSDADSAWEENPEVKEALGHEQRDDGLFWMSWADFQATFTSVEVCAKTMPTKRASHDK